MRIAIEAQRIFRTNKHGMDFVALESIRELQKIDKENEYFIFLNTHQKLILLKQQKDFSKKYENLSNLIEKKLSMI